MRNEQLPPNLSPVQRDIQLSFLDAIGLAGDQRALRRDTDQPLILPNEPKVKPAVLLPRL